MFLLHITGPGVDLRREWFDTSHPALAAHTHDSPGGRGRFRWLIRPLSIGGAGHPDLALPGLLPLHAYLEQASPGQVRVRAQGEAWVDGVQVVETAPLPLGSELRFAAYALRVQRTAPLDQTMLARLATLVPGNDQAWRVFADEAEESGKPALAEWMRLERGVTDATRAQLATVGATLTASERAAVGTAKIIGCNAHACPGRWDAMGVTSDARFRDCPQCQKAVSWCEKVQEAASFVTRGLPAVLDSGQAPPKPPWPLVTIG